MVLSQWSVAKDKDTPIARTNFENLRVYQLPDEIWRISSKWNRFAQDTVGKQIVRAGDSIGANCMARGSLNETQHWLCRAYTRGLLMPDQVSTLKPLVDELAPKLNAYLKSIGKIRRDRPS